MLRKARLHEILVEHSIVWATEHWPGEAVFALGLAYGAGWPPIPTVGLLTVAERDALLQDPDEYGVGLVLWNPGEYEIVDFLEVPEEAVVLAEELAGGWEHDEDWFRFMGGVATALAAHDWSSLGATTDFVVFANVAMDINEQAQLERQLAMSVPAERLDDLRERGWLHVTPPDGL